MEANGHIHVFKRTQVVTTALYGAGFGRQPAGARSSQAWLENSLLGRDDWTVREMLELRNFQINSRTSVAICGPTNSLWNYILCNCFAVSRYYDVILCIALTYAENNLVCIVSFAK